MHVFYIKRFKSSSRLQYSLQSWRMCSRGWLFSLGAAVDTAAAASLSLLSHFIISLFPFTRIQFTPSVYSCSCTPFEQNEVTFNLLLLATTDTNREALISPNVSGCWFQTCVCFTHTHLKLRTARMSDLKVQSMLLLLFFLTNHSVEAKVTCYQVAEFFF